MIRPPLSRSAAVGELGLRLTSLKGIGPKRAEMLAKRGLFTLLDLLFFIPSRYEDRSRVTPIAQAAEGVSALVKGKVVSGGEAWFPASRKRLFKAVVQDGADSLELIWFNYRKAHLERLVVKGRDLAAYGTVRVNRERKQMIHPDAALWQGGETDRILGIYPVYPSVEGVSPQVLRSIVRSALDRLRHGLPDPIPRGITQPLELPELGAAVEWLHRPPPDASIEDLNRLRSPAHKRLLFQRFFEVMLGVGLRRRSRRERLGRALALPVDILERVRKFFPFALTAGQMQAIEEILTDLTGERPMNRLLQGDVGCGKTAAAVAAAYATVSNGLQAALMAPTQVLARQHFAYFSSLPEEMGFRPALLTGAYSRADRTKIYEQVANGESNLVIGTQSLIQDGLSFEKLGLVVIDEQHRFGVRQRGMLDRKGSNPHLLIMTATPIPRTLAMVAYADLDISTIREYPEGRLPVKTRLVGEGGKRDAFNEVKSRLAAGEQGLVICPVIEGTEEGDLKNALEMHAKLQKIFTPPYRVELIHGRLSSEEKERVMEDFRQGAIDLLVGTTVVEVGVHAPGAAFIVVEHPERFGLSQLHQLRGRVGREGQGGVCLMMLSPGLPESALSRLKVMADCSDGFEIALRDLELRGQGQFMGTRQSGAGELDYEEILDHPELLRAAKKAADAVVDADPLLSTPSNRPLRALVEGLLSELPLTPTLSPG